MMILLGKLLFAVAAAVVSTLAVLWPAVYGLSDRAFTRVSCMALLLSRLMVFTFFFLILRVSAQSDVTVYYEWTRSTLAGGIPGRDFPMIYGPLFTYLAGAAVWVVNSPKSIVLLTIFFEAISYPFWLAVGRELFPEPTVRRAAILYISSPIGLYDVGFLGHNHVWISLLLGPAVLLLLRRRELASGIMMGLSIVAVKFLSLLFVPGLFMASRRKTIWALGLVLFPVVVYGISYRLGLDALGGVAFHSQHSSSGNIPYFLTLVGLNLQSPSTLRVVNAAGLLVLAAVFLRAVFHGCYRGRAMIHLMTLVLLVTLLVSKKAFTPYLMVAFFPFCLTTSLRPPTLPRLAAMGVFGILVTVESSLWYRWLDNKGLDLVWRTPLPAEFNRGLIGVFLACEILLLAMLACYAVTAWRAVRDDQAAPGEPAAATAHLK